MKRAWVTGAGGFVGGFLVEALLAKGWRVFGLDAAPYPWPLPPDAAFAFTRASVLDGDAVRRALEEAQPDAVFHLAAQSYPRVSWTRPVETFEVNVLGAVRLIEALRSIDTPPRVLMVGSSAEYAPVGSGKPIDETTPVDPSTPYGISKQAQDALAEVFGAREGLPMIRARPFFLVGPRKQGDVCSDWARGVVAIERGKSDRLSVGNVGIVRDMLDVRDGVDGMIRLVEAGEPGRVYNICSGRGMVLREVLQTYCALAERPVETIADPERMRAADEPIRVGDPSRLMALGWRPARALRDTLADILDYWRSV